MSRGIPGNPRKSIGNPLEIRGCPVEFQAIRGNPWKSWISWQSGVQILAELLPLVARISQILDNICTGRSLLCEESCEHLSNGEESRAESCLVLKQYLVATLDKVLYMGLQFRIQS